VEQIRADDSVQSIFLGGLATRMQYREDTYMYLCDLLYFADVLDTQYFSWSCAYYSETRQLFDQWTELLVSEIIRSEPIYMR
jgi:hypothetical protein